MWRGCHWSPLEVSGLLAWWPSVGLGRGLILTGHPPCVRPCGSAIVLFLDETQRGQCLAQGHIARDVAGRCADPAGLQLTIVHRSALCLCHCKAQVARGDLHAEAAQRCALHSGCSLLPVRESSDLGGLLLLNPSWATGLHQGESSSQRPLPPAAREQALSLWRGCFASGAVIGLCDFPARGVWAQDHLHWKGRKFA